MADVRWHDADGSTVTLIATDVARLRVSSDTTTTYDLNTDRDGDGQLDAILADVSYSTRGFVEYGVFYDDPAVPNPGGNSYDAFMVVIDYSRTGGAVTYRPDRYAAIDVAYLGARGRDIVQGNQWKDALVAGNDGNDILTTAHYNDKLYGGDGADQLSGGGGNDFLRGDAGRDILFGGDGSDRLVGGGDGDFLDGGSGTDILTGGAGRDRLTGGDGSDRFVFAQNLLVERDVVTDFSQAEGDTVDLSSFGAGLRFVDEGRFTGVAGEVRTQILDERTALVFDLDGDRQFDGAILFLGTIDFTAADLILPPAIG